MDLPKAVRTLRELTGDSQQAFAARLGLSIRAIANYEKDRVPTGRALYQLLRLARELGRQDLAEKFSSALSAEFADSIEPLNPEEKAWSNAAIALFRNKDMIDWKRFSQSIVNSLEDLSKKCVDKNVEAILVEARYRLSSFAEREIASLAKKRQTKTHEGYEKAYSEVLLENPDLYTRYLQERAEAARGTSFEKSMVSPKGARKTK